MNDSEDSQGPDSNANEGILHCCSMTLTSFDFGIPVGSGVGPEALKPSYPRSFSGSGPQNHGIVGASQAQGLQTTVLIARHEASRKRVS